MTQLSALDLSQLATIGYHVGIDMGFRMCQVGRSCATERDALVIRWSNDDPTTPMSNPTVTHYARAWCTTELATSKREARVAIFPASLRFEPTSEIRNRFCAFFTGAKTGGLSYSKRLRKLGIAAIPKMAGTETRVQGFRTGVVKPE